MIKAMLEFLLSQRMNSEALDKIHMAFLLTITKTIS